MPTPEPEAQSNGEEAESPADDVDALLALAKSYRAGTAVGGRDMAKCLETYRAAAALGSSEAAYAVALFVLNGGVVPQDLKEGATLLRSAAEKGSVPARVCLGNLYELGIHYKADPEKADVWYRNAARAARIEEEPDTPEHGRALAELGCVRHVLALVESGELAEEEKTRLLQRAKTHGYGLRIRDDAATDTERLTLTDALASADAPLPAPLAPAAPKRERENTVPATPVAKKEIEAARKPVPKKKSAGPGPAAAATAFAYATLFAMAGLGAAYAATLGARELVAHGHSLPWLGTRTHLVFPIVLGVVGVLPSWLVYRLSALVKALVSGAAVGAVGFVAWGAGHGAVHLAREVQVIAFGLAGFLAALLVFGLLGGTKRSPRAN